MSSSSIRNTSSRRRWIRYADAHGAVVNAGENFTVPGNLWARIAALTGIGSRNAMESFGRLIDSGAVSIQDLITITSSEYGSSSSSSAAALMSLLSSSSSRNDGPISIIANRAGQFSDGTNSTLVYPTAFIMRFNQPIDQGSFSASVNLGVGSGFYCALDTGAFTFPFVSYPKPDVAVLVVAKGGSSTLDVVAYDQATGFAKGLYGHELNSFELESADYGAGDFDPTTFTGTKGSLPSSNYCDVTFDENVYSYGTTGWNVLVGASWSTPDSISQINATTLRFFKTGSITDIRYTPPGSTLSVNMRTLDQIAAA
jgi:hypothetical protein